MRKIILAVILFAAILFSSQANASPSVVMLKFSDDTRFDALNGRSDAPAIQLSERILKRLAQSKKFTLPSLEPLDEDLEARLYDEKVSEYADFTAAVNSGNYNAFFESGGFSEKKAQSIATAQVGQIITPEITQAIGAAHNADYLIQGTIINLGTGDWLNENLEFISGAVTQYASVAAAYGSNVLGFLGNFGTIDVQTKGIGVQCDVRVIKAASGEVVWSKRVTGVAEQSLIDLGPVAFGHADVSYSLYEKAVNKAVDKIAEALFADMSAGKIF